MVDVQRRLTTEAEGAEPEQQEAEQQGDLGDEPEDGIERAGRDGARRVAPERWKNRMLVAARAAVDGTAMLMKQTANMSLVTRIRGTVGR